MVDLSLNEEVDAFVIAGDLFDGEKLSFATERFLLEQLSRLNQAGISVVYATGNHDAPTRARRGAALQWPANVLVAAGPEPRRQTVFDRDGTPVGHITAAGHATDRESRNLSAGFLRPPGNDPEVAVLHTHASSAAGAARHGRYAPSDVAGMARAGFDYWALGHIHQREVLSEQPMICYSGSPQGLGFGEVGPRGCLVVDLKSRRTPDVRFCSIAPLRFEVLRVGGIEEARSLDAVVRRVVEHWEDARRMDPADPGAEWIVRVELEGPAALAHSLRRTEDQEALQAELQAVLDAAHVERSVSRTQVPVRTSDYIARGDVLGEALRLVEELRGGAEPLDSVAPDDLGGLDISGGGERDAYLRSLLQDASGELLTRLLREAGQP